ncbi:MAG: hypothetical protein WKF47_06430 [Geodermatophilaceae bacterium]
MSRRALRMTVRAKRQLFAPAVFAELDEDGMREPIDVRLQTADAIAQPLGQHRDDAIRQIDAVAALQRFAIELAAGAST